MKEYLWLYRGETFPVGEQSILGIFEKNGIRAACLWNQDEHRILHMEEVLLNECLVENGILIEKDLLCEAGGKNTRLMSKWEYELALRVAEMESIHLVPSALFAEEERILEKTGEKKDAQDVWEEFCTDAYIVGRYRDFLKERGLLEVVLETVLAEGVEVESTEKVERFLEDMIGGPKYNFIFDHPIWMQEQLQHVPERYHVLTHDRNYQSFIQKYDSGVADVHLLPPGGRTAEGEWNREKRIYDVTFLGTYGDYRGKLAVIADCEPRVKFMAARFLLYMKKNPDNTAEMAFQRMLDSYNMKLEQADFLELFGKLKEVIQCIMYYYREKVVGKILQAGIELHVFGDSWRGSPFAQNPFLKMHEAVYGEEAVGILGKSKISLNVMAWHKDGFTERIADSMLAGAVVVSDYSKQLEEFYGKETVLYDLKHLEELPDILAKLLADDNRRSGIAKVAEKKAVDTATWEVRAKTLTQIIEEESRNR